MPSPKISIALLGAAFFIQPPLNELRAAPESEAAALEESTQFASAPDGKQIQADLKDHYLFGGAAIVGAGPVRYGPPESTAIRSSVRNGDVLEFRVSSLLFEDSNRDNRLEVDSIVRYRADGNRWALVDVQTARTRSVNAPDSSASGESC